MDNIPDMDNESIAKVKPGGNKPSASPSEESKDEPSKKPVEESKDKQSDAPKTDNKPKDAVKEENDEEAEKQAKKDKKKSSPTEMVKDGVKNAEIVSGAEKVAILTKLFMMLKNMAAIASAAVQSFLGNAINAVMGVVHGITGFVSGGISAISAFFGTTATIATVAVSGVTGIAVIGIVAVVINVNASSHAMRSDNVYDCGTDVKTAISSAAPTDVSAQQKEVVKKIYDVFKQKGLADYNIAGIVGNWTQESGLDPTCVEGLESEMFNATAPDKVAALNDLSDFTQNTLFPMYHRQSYRINETGYVAADGKYYCGIGLGQWTADRAKMLIDYAKGANKSWMDEGVQLAFAIAPADKGGDPSSTTFNSWADEASPESAAMTFLTKWEGINNHTGPERGAAATTWATEFASWQVDTNYANSIISMSGSVQANASDNAVSNATSKCSDNSNVSTNADNSSLASAAVSYAYATRNEGLGNNGTELYQSLHQSIFPGDEFYQSCDRSVAVGVRWSGTDDSFPAGPVQTILSYLSTSPKWQQIPSSGSTDGLQPGDVLIRPDGEHIIMYVGNEAVKAKYPDDPDTYCIVSGSLNERSPGCDNWDSSYGSYTVFRNIQKESSSQYTNASTSSSVVVNK